MSANAPIPTDSACLTRRQGGTTATPISLPCPAVPRAPRPPQRPGRPGRPARSARFQSRPKAGSAAWLRGGRLPPGGGRQPGGGASEPKQRAHRKVMLPRGQYLTLSPSLLPQLGLHGPAKILSSTQGRILFLTSKRYSCPIFPIPD